MLWRRCRIQELLIMKRQEVVLTDKVAVADARREFGDVLNRAHFYDKVISITKRERPFAAVVSAKDGDNVVAIKEVASALKIEPSNLVDLLKALPKDQLRAMLFGDAP